MKKFDLGCLIAIALFVGGVALRLATLPQPSEAQRACQAAQPYYRVYFENIQTHGIRYEYECIIAYQNKQVIYHTSAYGDDSGGGDWVAGLAIPLKGEQIVQPDPRTVCQPYSTKWSSGCK